MAADPVTPLCSVAQFMEGAFADLAADYPPAALPGLMAEATRKCEDETDRRLAPFTATETTRAQGIDPDEYQGATSMPMSLQGTLGASYASSLGVQNLVRHCWLAEYPARYQDMWAYPDALQAVVYQSYGGVQSLGPAQILQGPDDTGHVWFQLGQFVPVGSRIQVTYSGGYSPVVPASLKRAQQWVAASVLVREMNPDSTQHDPDQLLETGISWLKPFMRDGGGRK